MTSPRTDTGLIQVRFVGVDPSMNAVPIYDLGTVLIAFQRIIYKSYLFAKDRPTKGIALTEQERDRLAFGIVDRRQGSDLYHLAPLLTDPVITTWFAPFIIDGMRALGQLTYQRIARSVQNKAGNGEGATELVELMDATELVEHDETRYNVLATKIFHNATEIAGRVNGPSGIRAIEIDAEAIDEAPKVTIDGGVKAYLGALSDEVVLGDLQAITGVLKQLRPQSNIMVLAIPGADVSVKLDGAKFDQVRYSAPKDARIVAEGRPIYRIGDDTEKLDAFEAYNIRIEGR